MEDRGWRIAAIARTSFRHLPSSIFDPSSFPLTHRYRFGHRAMKESYRGPLERVSECCWRIPKSYKAGMRVDGLIYSSDEMIEQVKGDQAPDQVANVAFLP